MEGQKRWCITLSTDSQKKGTASLSTTEAFDRRSQFDIFNIHLNNSQDYIALPLSIYSSTPVVFTLHFKLPILEERKDRHIVLKKYGQLPFTSISDSQRKNIEERFTVATMVSGYEAA